MRHRLTAILILIVLTVTGAMAAGCGSAAEPQPDTLAQPTTLSQPTAPPAADAVVRETLGDTAEAGADEPPPMPVRESPPFTGSMKRSGETGSGEKSAGETSAGSMAAPERGAAGGDGPMMTAEPMMTADSSMMPARGPERSGDGTARRQQRNPLRAGEVDDNLLWREYLEFVKDYRGPPAHATDLRRRQVVTVVDRDGQPVPNARVTLRARDSQEAITQLTYADGRTILFPTTENPAGGLLQQGGITVIAERDGFTSSIEIPEDSNESSVTITLEGTMEYGRNVPLDVLFLLDSTGSMADEIHRIKTTLHSIARQVSDLPASPDLRFGMVAYRDRGDDYVTRLYDFDGDADRFRDTIDQVKAEGGGDYPESLNQALHEAINDMRWRRDAVRLILLVADAPPHLDYPQDEDYAREMVEARRRGIKIFSVASSGLDDRGEYIFRQLAQQTMGKFIFILYPTGARGSLESLHSVEQYTVDRLDALIVRLIREELRHLGDAEDDRMRMK